MIKENVSASQFFALLYLSLLSGVFMYISSPKVEISQADSVLLPLVFIFVGFISAVPSMLVCRFCSKNMICNVNINKTGFLRLIAAFYGVTYFVCALNTAARFDLFASSELFPNSDMTLFIVFIVFICGFLSLLGLGALARAGAIFTFIVVITTVIVMFSLRDEVDILNFSAPFKNGALKFLGDGIGFSLQGAEIGAIILFVNQIEGEIKKKYVLWLTLGALSFSVLLFFVVGSLGAFADTQIFPTYTAVSLASFGLLERIDALETAVWILCVVEKISFCLLITVESFSYVFEKLRKRKICLMASALLGITLIYISESLERFYFFSYKPLIAVLYFMPVVILPFSLYVYLRRRKPYDQEN